MACQQRKLLFERLGKLLSEMGEQLTAEQERPDRNFKTLSQLSLGFGPQLFEEDFAPDRQCEVLED